MSKITELAIVGAGPAGMSATIEAQQMGIETLLIDSAPALGGQVYRQTSPEFADSPQPAARKMFDQLTQMNISVYRDTTVWGIFPEDDQHQLCLYGPDEVPRRVLAKTVILAPGAYERPTPFPGWTLPGVMTVGAALILVKQQHILPGRRVLISGTGPLSWLLAHKLIEAGAEMVKVLDANPFPWQGWRYLPRFWGQGERIKEGLDAILAMGRTEQMVHWGQTVLSAQGKERVGSATFGRINGANMQTISVDTLCLGYGFVPAVQLSRQAGCEHHYDAKLGGWVPIRDRWLETTVPGIFVAGDGAGIGGKDKALYEGQLAALGVAHIYGKTFPAERVALVQRNLQRQKQFANVLNTLFPFPTQTLDLLTDETYICRCEGVRVVDVRQMISEGATTLGLLRKLSRAGMGRCQGRFCGHTLAAILSQETGQPIDQLALPTPRPPVMPIPLHGLADHEED
jgi:NADPH-dependent 2,4-dienoyl-CoA reductase/sulfur reductase-like enzyme/bacterioferritin-associated ferredoxin